jgi:hypothetical protein
MFQPNPSLLRRALIADLATAAPTTVLLVVAAGWIAPLVGLEPALLRGIGVAFAPFVLLLVWALRTPRPAALVVAVLNIGWFVLSIAALLLGWIAPSGSGAAIVAAQAFAVLALGLLQLAGLRRLGAVPASA